MGAIAGYAARGGRLFLVLLVIALIGSFILGAASAGLAGVFCGLVLAGITFVPIAFGVLMGVLLRGALKSSSFSQRDHLPLILFALIGPVWAAAEGPPPIYQTVTVTTSRVIAAPVNAVWDSIVFFEDVRHEPPLILRVGLAHPLYTFGKSVSPGDQKTCVYNKGRITKEVTEVRTGQLLAFKVIEQDIGYERDVTLEGGAFQLAAIDPTHTAVTLSTTYIPRLGPRFAWRPFEELAVHTLHDHVLQGMGLSATGDGAYRDAPRRVPRRETGRTQLQTSEPHNARDDQ